MNAVVARLVRHRAAPVKKLLFACLTTAAFAIGSPSLAQSITSEVTAYGSDDPPPAQRATTNVPGQSVSASAQASFSVSNPPNSASGTTSGSSFAQTDYGVNRVAASGGLVGVNETWGSGLALVDTTAYSFWTDNLTITGGAAGDLVNLSFSGRTTYSLDLVGGAVATAPAVTLEQTFVANSPIDGGQVTLSNAQFASNAALGFVDWTFSLAARSGDLIGLTMSFNVGINSSFQGLQLGSTDKRVSFDSSKTALLETLDVTDGYALSSASGELVVHNGAFAYNAVLADTVTPIPEPETYALMLAGLGLMSVIARRRRLLV